ncbi:hypothetical protein [Aquimarina rubra]|uniref:Uncharacterized protein n=1 Tax=Aquimarina rubra TaxID=1920033 RepID=A0ABW5LD19_9FLAO
MKTIFFTIAVLFSTLTISAQETDHQECNVKVENVKSSKVDFFKALVKANNFDITIKDSRKEVTSNINTTKTEFYKSLLEKTGFKTDLKKTTRLTEVLERKEDTKKMIQKNAVVSLIP